MFVGVVVVMVDVLSEDFDDILFVGRIRRRGGSHSHDGGENKLKYEMKNISLDPARTSSSVNGLSQFWSIDITYTLNYYLLQKNLL